MDLASVAHVTSPHQKIGPSTQLSVTPSPSSAVFDVESVTPRPHSTLEENDGKRNNAEQSDASNEGMVVEEDEDEAILPKGPTDYVYNEGDKVVHVLSLDEMYPCKILEEGTPEFNNGYSFVHYLGWKSSHDNWVPNGELLPGEMGDAALEQMKSRAVAKKEREAKAIRERAEEKERERKEREIKLAKEGKIKIVPPEVTVEPLPAIEGLPDDNYRVALTKRDDEGKHIIPAVTIFMGESYMDSRREYQEGWNKVKMGLMEEASVSSNDSAISDVERPIAVERPNAVELWQGREMKDVMSIAKLTDSLSKKRPLSGVNKPTKSAAGQKGGNENASGCGDGDQTAPSKPW